MYSSFEFSNGGGVWDDILDESVDKFHARIYRRCCTRLGKQTQGFAIAGVEACLVLKHRNVLAHGCKWKLYEDGVLVQEEITSNGESTQLRIALGRMHTYKLEIINRPIPKHKRERLEANAIGRPA